ncbi:hypothetical protein ACFE04_019043 [Oxalis oulophora]
MMFFETGDRVEVSSKLEGYVGSYYAGTVISRNDVDSCYVVEYDTLVEKEESNKPLREVVGADLVRPRPPERWPVTSKWVPRKVDAYDKDGWWQGKSVSRVDSKLILVNFDDYDEEIVYPVNRLRPHLEWKDGKWIVFRESSAV